MIKTWASNTGALHVGAVAIANGAFLAPMSGVTDAPFRRLVSKLGAGLVVSEMTASEGLAAGDRDAAIRAGGKGEHIHVVQLAGCEARWMAEGARVAQDNGADIIDINMGCPARKVTNGYSGSALMRDLDHALSLITATVSAASVPVTLKMRLGWDAASINAPELAARAEEAGVQMIAVHGRTRCQFYTGTADWAAIAAVKDAVGIPVVVNGDITRFDDVDTALSLTGADAVMIGRGALGRPWFPGDVGHYLQTRERRAAPPLHKQKSLLLGLYADLLTHYGSAVGVRHARKHLRAALDVAAESARCEPELLAQKRLAVLTEADPDQVVQRIDDAYDAIAWRMAA